LRASSSKSLLARGGGEAPRGPVPSDVSLLAHADDHMVTDVLCERYAERRVYTRCGADVLLLVTPNKPLDRYFDEAAKSKYRDGRLHELPPHIYLIAEEAYRRVRLMKAVVPIVVVGESGSGKTEAVKELVRYTLWRSSGEPGASASARLANSIDASFLVLEAFGNARTLTSRNSSRFGLLRRLYIGQLGIHGASYRVYLFDRWRVLGPRLGEYNFHAFYAIVEGAPAALRESIGLTIARGARQFACLVQGGGLGQEQGRSLSGAGARDEAALFNSLYAAFAELGMSDALRFGVLKLAVAVLQLNNVDAARMSIHGAARGGNSTPAPAQPGSRVAGGFGSIRQKPFGSGDMLLRSVCSLLEIDSTKPGSDLRESLFARSLQLRGERITIPHTAEQVPTRFVSEYTDTVPRRSL
jgi:myosin heavy subunit